MRVRVNGQEIRVIDRIVIEIEAHPDGELLPEGVLFDLKSGRLHIPCTASIGAAVVFRSSPPYDGTFSLVIGSEPSPDVWINPQPAGSLVVPSVDPPEDPERVRGGRCGRPGRGNGDQPA
jgi:hypothetical protein